ncbi:hypothetical protein ACS0TY_010255 [Phlomoides rotata]
MEKSKSICLVGRPCSGKSINVFALMEVMTRAFRPKGKLTTRDWGNGMIIFFFDSFSDWDCVVRNQP